MQNLETLPRELNGYPVEKIRTHANCATVLVKRADSYVVATWWPDLGESWMWGHYFHLNAARDDLATYHAATADFHDTAKRNATR